MANNEEQDFFDVPQLLHLTPEKVRSYPQFADATDEEVFNIINSLYDLSLITYDLVSKELTPQSPEPGEEKE